MDRSWLVQEDVSLHCDVVTELFSHVCGDARKLVGFLKKRCI